MANNDLLLQTLIKYWGHSSFREKQQEIMQAILSGKDTLALLPTGGGKSICFQIPALVKPGICLVISPLIALMHDQVNNLKAKGIKALAVTSAMSRRELDIALDNAAYGNFKFLYLSPERLQTELFKERLKKMEISFVAVDEAHCISQWGYDFRPAYLEIAKLRTQLPKVAFLALTATATNEVVKDIQDQLLFSVHHTIKKSFKRENIAYVIRNTENQQENILSILNGVRGSGIIYVATRKKTKELSYFLNQHSISADYYHAGLSAQEREDKQTNWITNKIRVIVATNAFGMGIDKPNVRFVIHVDLPSSLEAYFQEAGRAGRDEKKAYAVLLNTPSMVANLRKQIDEEFPERAVIKRIYTALANFFQIPVYGGLNQSFEFDTLEFSKRYNFNVKEVYRSIHFLEKEGEISISENFATHSRLNIELSKTDLYKFQVENKTYDSFIKGVLRTYGGLFENFVKINESILAKNLQLPVKKVLTNLDRLTVLGVFNYQKQSAKPHITYLKPRKDSNNLIISKVSYENRKKIALKQCDAVIEYVNNKVRCRSQVLLRYFGEKDSSRCGICDICIERNKLELNDIAFKELQHQIIEAIGNKPITINQLKIKGFSKIQIEKTLNFLLDTHQIQTDGVSLFKNEQ